MFSHTTQEGTDRVDENTVRDRDVGGGSRANHTHVQPTHQALEMGGIQHLLACHLWPGPDSGSSPSSLKSSWEQMFLPEAAPNPQEIAIFQGNPHNLSDKKQILSSSILRQEIVH